MPNKIYFQFKGPLWRTEGKGGWFFINLPKKITTQIRKEFKEEEEGWGRLKCLAKINSHQWHTAIWFDTKADTYLLPIKVEVRKKLAMVRGVDYKVTLLFKH